jgi:hypothetical protein
MQDAEALRKVAAGGWHGQQCGQQHEQQHERRMAPGIAAVAKLAPFAKLGPFSEQQLQQLGALQAQLLLQPSATAAAPRTSPTPPAAAAAAHAAAPVSASVAAPEMALGGTNSHLAGKSGLATPASPMHKQHQQQQQHASSDDGDGTNTAAETSPESDRGHLLPATGVTPGV